MTGRLQSSVTATETEFHVEAYEKIEYRLRYAQQAFAIGNTAIADTLDTLGVARNDPLAHTVEMDDATLPLALTGPPADLSQRWLSIRNVSEPQVDSKIGDIDAQKQWAFQIFTKYGYWTSIGSAITCWGVIADL